MFVGNKKKVMDTLIYDCTQKMLANVATFLYMFTSQKTLKIGKIKYNDLKVFLFGCFCHFFPINIFEEIMIIPVL